MLFFYAPKSRPQNNNIQIILIEHIRLKLIIHISIIIVQHKTISNTDNKPIDKQIDIQVPFKLIHTNQSTDIAVIRISTTSPVQNQGTIG